MSNWTDEIIKNKAPRPLEPPRPRQFEVTLSDKVIKRLIQAGIIIVIIVSSYFYISYRINLHKEALATYEHLQKSAYLERKATLALKKDSVINLVLKRANKEQYSARREHDKLEAELLFENNYKVSKDERNELIIELLDLKYSYESRLKRLRERGVE